MSLKSSKNVETNVYELEITVSAEDFEAAVQATYLKQRKKISLPGFRKGKATRSMIESMYGKNVFYEDALESIYPKLVEEAIKDAELTTVDAPQDVEVKEIGADGVLITMKVTVKPEAIEVGEYKGIIAEKPSAIVKDDEIDAEIKRLQERNSRMVSVEDRAVENEDIVEFDFEGFVDGVAFDGGKAEHYSLTIGSGQFIPGFEEQLIGHSIGEEFDINVKFPSEYAPELADKDAVFKIKLHEIKVKEFPEVDDDFAKDVGEEYETVADLRKGIEEDISSRKQSESKNAFENAVLKQIDERLEAEIPECMFNKRLEDNIKSFEQRISSQGIDLNTYLMYIGSDMDTFRADMLEQAIHQVRVQLAVEKIAEIEGIDAGEEEISAEIESIAKQYNIDAETVKKIVSVDGVKADVVYRKTVEFIIENAKAVEIAEAEAVEETEEALNNRIKSE